VWVYIDHILILSNKADEHMEHIEEVCRKLKEVHFWTSRTKSEFLTFKISLPGYVVDNDGLYASSGRSGE